MQPRPDRLFDYREFPVLYVDDEPENLRIFELTFRREFAVLTARSGEAALEVLHRSPVAVVLSDHRMPGMTGAEFLARVAEIDPHTVRILVTAYGDVETLKHAINNGSIYRYVPKPWTPDEMRITLRRGIEVYALDREREQLLRELTVLSRVSRSINQELTLERLLDLILGIVVEELGYDAAALLFFDRRRETLSFARQQPCDGPVADALRKLELPGRTAPGFVGRIISGEMQILSIDQALGLEGPVREWVTEVSAEEILVAPLISKSEVFGAIAVDNRRGGRRFAADDRTLIEGLATQAAIAIGNARLVDDLRSSQQQVRRAERLGTLGTLAAGLAHEINNPLVSIHTFMSMAPDKRHDDDPEFWGDYHGLASREVERIRRLVDTMRRLGRDESSALPREPFDMGTLAREVATLAEPEARRAGVSLRVDVDAGTPKVLGVRDQLHQVALNLVLNAIGASEEGADVDLRIFPEPDAPAVRLEVVDRGEGIPEEHLDRIFDPFFTTKDPDRGTGLGLMICHRIVTDHGGTIEVQSRESGGATFSVRLPLDSCGPGPSEA